MAHYNFFFFWFYKMYMSLGKNKRIREIKWYEKSHNVNWTYNFLIVRLIMIILHQPLLLDTLYTGYIENSPLFFMCDASFFNSSVYVPTPAVHLARWMYLLH